jgi:cyclin B
LIFISDNAYTREQILRKEKAILNRLQWNLTVPTPYVFLVHRTKALSSSDSKKDQIQMCSHYKIKYIIK